MTHSHVRKGCCLKRIVSLLLCLALALCLLPCSALADNDFWVDAKAALLIDLNSGEILYESNAGAQVYPASLTKIMTAILAIENGNLDDVVTASANALTGLDPDGTSVWLTSGEQMTLHDLLYCIMLASANDACNVVAEHIAGSIDSFVDMMNQKAKELGCKDTHFHNAHGLPDEEHWTTARDLAVITQYAIQNPTFWEICTTPAYTVPATNVFDARILATTNSMETTYKYYTYYDARVQGVKTGYTAAAGRCLIVTGKDGDNRLLSVVCGAPDMVLYNNVSWYGHYAATEQLLNYGFDILENGYPEEEPAEEPEAPQAEPEPEAPAAPEQEPQAPAEAPVEQPQAPAQAPAETPEPAAAAPEKAEKSFPWLLAALLFLGVVLEACIIYVLVERRRYAAHRKERAVAQAAAQEPSPEELFPEEDDILQ